MVVKFFSNKKGGSSASVKYLLNERERLGTAKVLQGDPKLTQKIINQIQRKQKATVGCLSFEEKNIPQEQKYQLMKEFEEMLLPGLATRYNILWVEHTDKGRLELNFVIPKTDLETGKALQPYYHKADMKRKELWQELVNLEHGYSSVQDPSKERTLEGASKQVNLQKDYEQLDKLLHNLVEEGTLKNREQIVELLQENNIEVTRQGKDYISVKLPESKKARRLKGSIYNEEFTSPREFEAISEKARERIDQYNSRDTRREIENYKQELREFTQHKARENERRYPRVDIREHELKPQTHSKSNSDILPHDRNIRNLVSDERLASADRVTSRGQTREIHQEQEVHISQRNGHSLYQDRGLDDSTGTRAIKRARATRETQQEFISSIGTEGKEVYRRLNKSYKAIREHSATDERELREYTQRGTSEEQTAIRSVHEEREIKQPSLTERFKEAYGYAKEYISTKVQEIARKLEEMRAKELKAQEIAKAVREVEQEYSYTPSRSRGFGRGR